MIYSPRFNAMFQLKSFGGNEQLPLINIKVAPNGGSDKLIVEYIGDAGGAVRALATAPLTGAKGVWLEVVCRVEYKDAGSVFVTIKRPDGSTVLSVDEKGLDMWRQGSYVRPEVGPLPRHLPQHPRPGDRPLRQLRHHPRPHPHHRLQAPLAQPADRPSAHPAAHEMSRAPAPLQIVRPIGPHATFGAPPRLQIVRPMGPHATFRAPPRLQIVRPMGPHATFRAPPRAPNRSPSPVCGRGWGEVRRPARWGAPDPSRRPADPQPSEVRISPPHSEPRDHRHRRIRDWWGWPSP